VFDTNVTIVGNVLTAPEWRRTTNTNSLVANFKVASTARRLDRESGRWVDGNSLRVRVNCWRKLAEGVASSIMVGDPVVVVGRLYTRDWTDTDGNTRTMYELEAVAVGHDLSRGRAKFLRNRPALGTSVVEDPTADAQVHGETTAAVADADAPARYGDGLFDDREPGLVEPGPTARAGVDPLATTDVAEADAPETDDLDGDALADDEAADDEDLDSNESLDSDETLADSDETLGGDVLGAGGGLDVTPTGVETAGGRRGRRSPRRVPVPA
jgi:single-strand DNA-binding protein